MKFTVELPDGIYSGELTQIPQTQYYRIPHDKERRLDGSYGGDGYWGGTVRDKSKPVPEVYRLNPDQTTPLDCKWIRFWWAMNPMLDREHFQLLLDNRWMLCNGTGWPGRYNCLTGEKSDDPLNPYKPPAFHGPLVNGGATVKGTVVGNNLYLDTLLTSYPVPASSGGVSIWLEQNKHMWYYATTVAQSGNITYTTFTGIDGNRQKLRIPILTQQRVSLPLKELDKLPVGFFPPTPLWKPSI